VPASLARRASPHPMTRPSDPAPWCLVATVVADHPESTGRRLFRPGAKVWVPDGFPGVAYETVTVIGHVHGAPRQSIVHIAHHHLTNWRVRPVYSPAVRARIAEVCGPGGSSFVTSSKDPTSEAYRRDLLRWAATFQTRSRHRRPG
jgi:hypothetical protein